MDTRLSFGKFKGKSIREIIASEPQYLDWCEENIDGFILTLVARAKRDIALAQDKGKKWEQNPEEAVDDFMRRH